jgi:hypothetical protein
MEHVREVAKPCEAAAGVFEEIEAELYENEVREMLDKLRKLPETAERYKAYMRARELMAQRNLGQVVRYLRAFLERIRYADEVDAGINQLWELPRTAERAKAFARARELAAQKKLGDLARHLQEFLREAAPLAQSPAASSTTSPAATPPGPSPAQRRIFRILDVE